MNDPAARRAAMSMRWRVDVSGVPVSVYGEDAYQHLQRVNADLARMKLALHRISGLGPGTTVGDAIRIAEAVLPPLPSPDVRAEEPPHGE